MITIVDCIATVRLEDMCQERRNSSLSAGDWMLNSIWQRKTRRHQSQT